MIRIKELNSMLIGPDGLSFFEPYPVLSMVRTVLLSDTYNSTDDSYFSPSGVTAA